MNIYEYQVKVVLKVFGVLVVEGVVIFFVDEVEVVVKSFLGLLWVVKFQIYVGGCGKGKFKELVVDVKGGVCLVFLFDEVMVYVKEMFGNILVIK